MTAEPTKTTKSQPVGASIDYTRFLDCVHCGLCTSACPTYLETGDENDSPRGRIYLMRAVTDGKLELSKTVKRHLDLCLDCRSCETACPSGVQYGRLIEPFRNEMQQAEKKASPNSGPDWFHRWILLGLFPYPKRMNWALLPARIAQALKVDRLIEALQLPKLMPRRLARMYSILPKLIPHGPPLPERLPAHGERRATVAFFTGCVSESIFNHVNQATVRVLQANGCDVISPPSQACCGAIHYHSGAGEQALQFLEQNLNAFPLDEVDAVIGNVAGCGAMLKDYGHIAEELVPENKKLHEKLSAFAGKIRDISEFLIDLGPIKPEGSIPLKATYHDACHLVHAQQIREQPRNLLSMIPGLELVPLAESDICCGAAGSYNLTEPEMADRLAARKLGNIEQTEAQALISANAGCTLQIQSTLKRAGHDVWVVHPIELLDLSYQKKQPPIPKGIS